MVSTSKAWERHSRIHAAFAALPLDESMLIVVDHEPRPLRLEFERRYPRGFVWSQRTMGAGRWDVEVRSIVARAPDDAESVRHFLRCCSVLAHASSDTIDAIALSARSRAFAKGQVLVDQDMQWPYLGLLRSGMLAAMMTASNGRERRLFDVLPGDVFGETETLDAGRSIAAFVAVTEDANTLLVPRGIAISAMKADFGFTRALAANCAQRSRSMAEALSQSVAKSAVARIAAALLPYASCERGLEPSLEPLRRMTQSQLAGVAGTANEVAARALAELEDVGAIARAGGRVARIDRSKLTLIVEDD
jgi:CRP-like cAMP-binding protein